MKKYWKSILMLIIFESVAITLWLTKGNLFYLLNFSYIGLSISLGLFLFIRKYKHARRVVQLLVGSYMLVYLGLICRENMQIEGFSYKANRRRREYGIPFTALPLSTHGLEIPLNCFVWNTCPKSKTPCV